MATIKCKCIRKYSFKRNDDVIALVHIYQVLETCESIRVFCMLEDILHCGNLYINISI